MAAQEYKRSLEAELPHSSRSKMSADRGGVKGEVSHGLTRANTSKAAHDSLRVLREQSERILADFAKRFLAGH